MNTSLRSLTGATLALSLGLAAPLAQAHTGHDHGLTLSLTQGLAHPFTGWDHLLAMLTVGAWSATLPAGRRVLAPGVFLAALLLGGLAGWFGWTLPGLEAAIALSVVALAGLWFVGSRAGVATGLAVIAAAGALHGLAHGAEIGAGALFAGYAVGFMLGSALLHAVGWLAGQGLTQWSVRLRQGAAALVGLAGMALLIARV